MDAILLTCINAGSAVVTTRGAAPKTEARSKRGMRFSDVQLKTGVRLRYPEQGNPKGQPVRLLHGYSDSWFSYSRILPLIEEVSRLRAGSAGSWRGGYTFPDFAADVLAFMDAMGLKKATIVGHSMGRRSSTLHFYHGLLSDSPSGWTYPNAGCAKTQSFSLPRRGYVL